MKIDIFMLFPVMASSFCHSCPGFHRDKLQQESTFLYGSLFSQGQAWIPVCTGMTELGGKGYEKLVSI
jgi:hypothetical protein